MPNYRLLALDLDGTLLSDDKEISEENRYWIHQAVDAGVVVIFATGRGYPRIKQLWQELGLDSPMVLLNGAEIWEGPNKLWKRHFIKPEDVAAIQKMAAEKKARFWGYNVDGFIRHKDWTDAWSGCGWMKFGMRHEDLNVVEELYQHIKSRPDLEVVQSSPNSMEISFKGITKETGVQEVCRFMGINMSQVMAIGDSPNDLSLLRSAGLSVAVDNASNQVKQAANKRTDSNNQGGGS